MTDKPTREIVEALEAAQATYANCPQTPEICKMSRDLAAAAEIVRAFGKLERLGNQGNSIQIWRDEDIWCLTVMFDSQAEQRTASTLIEAIESTDHE